MTEFCSCKLTTPNGYYYMSLCCKVCFFYINVGFFFSYFQSSYFKKETKRFFVLFFLQSVPFLQVAHAVCSLVEMVTLQQCSDPVSNICACSNLM